MCTVTTYLMLVKAQETAAVCKRTVLLRSRSSKMDVAPSKSMATPTKFSLVIMKSGSNF